ncbi:hypothetical protein QQF64_006990 [Cirrhinus molitorella]|uniref:Uncharacterized protein n=1 Tax=Cirrhinus molitorella TaxID=172907 RepID=A0ABR3M9F1_9TELE
MVLGPPSPESVNCRCIQQRITLHTPNPGLRFLASSANRGTHAHYSHMLADRSGMWMEDEEVCGSGGRKGTKGLIQGALLATKRRREKALKVLTFWQSAQPIETLRFIYIRCLASSLDSQTVAAESFTIPTRSRQLKHQLQEKFLWNAIKEIPPRQHEREKGGSGSSVEWSAIAQLFENTANHSMAADGERTRQDLSLFRERWGI